MKFTRLFSVLVLSLTVLGGTVSFSQTEWSNEIFISSGNTPDLVIDPQTATLHLVVMTSAGVKYIVLDRNGVEKSHEMVPGAESDRGMSNFGASLAIDSQKRPHVGYRIKVSDSWIYDVYYTRKLETGWAPSIKIADDQLRGYVVRLAADSEDRIHFGHGSVTNTETNTGPVNYYILEDGAISLEQHNVMQIRGDERFELDATSEGIVELVTGDYSYPDEGGPIYYWRSGAAGGELVYKGDIHDAAVARGGANGSPDLFIDAAKNVHVCYGAEIDKNITLGPSVHYCRLVNGAKVRDVRVTSNGELTAEGWIVPIGIASLAASEDGTKIVVAYLASKTGPLFARLSQDAGQTWGAPVKIADGWDSSDARNKHIVRAYRSNFYIVYPSASGIKLRHLKMTLNEPPVAEAGGPYTGSEGSPVMFEVSGSYDPDGSIINYLWDFKGDGTWDDTTAAPTNSYSYPDDFSGVMKIRVVDSDDEVSDDNANVTISNVAPTAEAGGPYTGTWGTNINFTGTFIEPGSADIPSLTFMWDLDDDGIYESNGQNVQFSYSRDESHKVHFKVTDKNGGQGLDSATVTITNSGPAVSQIPPQSVRKGETFSAITLDNFVTDSDNADDQITWSVTGVSHVAITITNRVASIAALNPQWIGSDTVQFVATDPGNRTGSSTTAFTVTPSNQPPNVQSIAEQVILENETFPLLYLDNYVEDPDNADSELTWKCSGNSELIVTLQNRVLHVAAPDSEWAGSENLKIVATDPEGLKDSTTVRFTVYALNDAPVVTKIQDQTILVGNSFTPIYLDSYVFDVDDPDSDIVWTAFGMIELQVQITNRVATITPPFSDWIGSETVIFYAKDPGQLIGNSITVFTVHTIDGVASEENIIPTKFALHPNYPNPFNPETTIRFDIPTASEVRIIVYNHLGQQVKALVNEMKSPGRYSVNWNGCDDAGSKVSSGVYLYRIEAEGFTSTQKMMLIF
ncbi:MAG: PKD domain-containing protein [Candidatus Zhuqueibacterota bacterium]